MSRNTMRRQDTVTLATLLLVLGLLAPLAARAEWIRIGGAFLDVPSSWQLNGTAPDGKTSLVPRDLHGQAGIIVAPETPPVGDTRQEFMLHYTSLGPKLTEGPLEVGKTRDGGEMLTRGCAVRTGPDEEMHVVMVLARSSGRVFNALFLANGAYLRSKYEADARRILASVRFSAPPSTPEPVVEERPARRDAPRARPSAQGASALHGSWVGGNADIQIAFKFSPDGTYARSTKMGSSTLPDSGRFTVHGDTLELHGSPRQTYSWRVEGGSLYLTDQAEGFTIQLRRAG